MRVVSCIHLESNTFFVVILFYSDIQIFSTFALHYSKSLFVSVGDSVGHLVASIFRNFLLQFMVVSRSYHIPLVLGIIKRSFNVGIACNYILVFRIHIIRLIVSLESFAARFLIQNSCLVNNNVLKLPWKSSHFLGLSNVVREGLDFDLVFSCDL